MLNKTCFVVVIIILTSLLYSLNIEYENTWYRYTSYVNSNAEYNNKLYSNTYCGLEIFNILENGDLEFDEVIEFNGVIHSLKIDQEHELLFVLVGGEMLGSYEKIYCYKLQEIGLELQFISGNPNTNYTDLDCVYTTDKYAIFGYQFIDKCYNFETEELETITYNFNYIIGSFNNKIIDYDFNTFTITIYNVDEINEPVLVSQISYEPEGAFRKAARKLDNSHILILLTQGLTILNIEDENNYFIESSLNIALDYSGDYLYPPEIIESNLVYLGSGYGENFVYDFTDIFSPQQIDYLYEENIKCKNYCLVELDSGKYIYKQSRNDGIRCYNVENIAFPNIESYGVTYPYFSSAFVQGVVYTLEGAIIEGIDPNTTNIVFQCEFPYNIFRYYSKQENMLILETYDADGQAHAVLIDLNSGLILEDIPQPYYFVKIYKDLIFLQNSNDILVKRLTSELDFELVATLPASSFTSISVFDDNLLWFSYSEGNYIFNCDTYNIEQDFQSEFQYGLYITSLIFKYDNRLIITTQNPMDEDFTPFVKLYDIEDITNPILLDTKDVSIIPLYYEIDDFILETQYGEPVKVYNKFSDSFTEPIQELDFNTLVHNLVFDTANNRIANESMNNLKTYTYEVTDNDLVIVAEISKSLSNHPNPFKPTGAGRGPGTTISFKLTDFGDQESALVEIYNIKGQRIKQLVSNSANQFSEGEHSVVWDGTDNQNKSVSSGVYFYTLKLGDRVVANKRMLLLK